MRVALVRGGRSLERDFSLQSGHHVATALRTLGHDVVEVDVDADLTRSLHAADVVFIALHGRDGEDGTLQLTCEALGQAYSGSTPLTCRLCFDKGLAKGVLHRAGLPTPPGYVIAADAVRHMGAGTSLRKAADRLGYPVVVKPAAQGSALGLSVVTDVADLTNAAMSAFDYGDRVLIERYIEGPEISISILGADLEPLPAVEIRTPGGVFDFETRISPGARELVCPANISSELLAQANRVAVEACKAVSLRDFGRVDLRIGEDGPAILDVKTCPGLTEGSIFPLAVTRSGARFEDFVARVVDSVAARSPTLRA